MILRIAQDHLGEGLLHRHLNSLNSRFDVRHDGGRCKTNDAKIIAHQPSGAPMVSDNMRLFAMLATVYLNH